MTFQSVCVWLLLVYDVWNENFNTIYRLPINCSKLIGSTKIMPRVKFYTNMFISKPSIHVVNSGKLRCLHLEKISLSVCLRQIGFRPSRFNTAYRKLVPFFFKSKYMCIFFVKDVFVLTILKLNDQLSWEVYRYKHGCFQTTMSVKCENNNLHSSKQNVYLKFILKLCSFVCILCLKRTICWIWKHNGSFYYVQWLTTHLWHTPNII